MGAVRVRAQGASGTVRLRAMVRSVGEIARLGRQAIPQPRTEQRQVGQAGTRCTRGAGTSSSSQTRHTVQKPSS